MKNNQMNQMEYINKLENENMLLREENKKIKQTFLSDCEAYNISLLQKSMRIDALEQELRSVRQTNAMLLLMK